MARPWRASCSRAGGAAHLRRDRPSPVGPRPARIPRPWPLPGQRLPIPAGETRTVDFTYTQVLERGTALPLQLPAAHQPLQHAPVEQVAVSVELIDQPGLRTIYSPNYPIRVDRTADDTALISYKTQSSQPEGDFDLYFGSDDSAIGLNLLSYKPAGEDGYFVLLATPGIDVAEDAIMARDVFVVVDVSGSMQGEKIEQAKAAAQDVVDHLNPEDRFNLVAFSARPRPGKTSSNLSAARRP